MERLPNRRSSPSLDESTEINSGLTSRKRFYSSLKIFIKIF